MSNMPEIVVEIHLEKLPDEPILILKYTGDLSEGLDQKAVDSTHRALERARRPFYLVIDTREMRAEFADIVTFIRRFQKSKTNDQSFLALPVIPPVIVGTNQLVEYVVREFEGLAVYRSMEDALSYIRKHVSDNESI